MFISGHSITTDKSSGCIGIGPLQKTDLGMPFQDRVPRRILPIPPTPAVLDQRVIDVGAIGQQHIGEGASSLVAAVRLERHFLPEDEVRGSLLGSLGEGLALLRAVGAAEADAFRMVIMQAIEVPLWRNGISASS